MSSPNALIIEDDEDFRVSLEALVAREGFETSGAGTLEEARAALEASSYDVLLVDRSLPDGDGLSFCQEADGLERTEVIVITGHGDVDSAVEALRAGALDYLTKPLDRPRLKTALANVSRTQALKAEVSDLRSELRGLGRFGGIVGRSKVMQEVFDMIGRVAPTDASVLVTGESGTGKEVVATAIHALSKRKKGPLEAVNCGAIPETLIESELFGHEKGSFTGADRTRKGFFERADGGTLFLDEITEMPIELQVKLLRVLETGRVQRVGGAKPMDVDVRVLGATNRDPSAAVQEGKLREDLFYRLAVFPLHLPPLRERAGDVELLAQHFLEDLNRENETRKTWSRAALDQLERAAWPGNVRELKNAVHRAFILSEDEIGPGALAPARGRTVPDTGDGSTIRIEIGKTIADAEQKLILATLERTDGDKRAASEILGISLKTLYNRLKVYEASAS